MLQRWKNRFVLMLIGWLLFLPSQATIWMVQFDDLQQQYVVEQADLRLLQPQHQRRGMALFSVSDQLDVMARLQLMQTLRQTPGIRWVAADGSVQAQLLPDDELIEQQALWQEPIGLPQVWDQQTDCRQTVIAILDSGVDISHEDLAQNIWQNPAEVAGNGLDDDGNGKVDDVSGWNFINDNDQVGDLYGHGTHVAGLVGAVANNQIGVSGACWQATLLPLKFLNRTGGGALSHAMNAIYYLIELAQSHTDYRFVLNNSWASAFNEGLSSAILDAEAAGILVVNAAGNASRDMETFPVYPAALAAEHLGIVTVANLDTQAMQPPYDLNESSNYGTQSVTLAAPGTHILSTWPTNLSTEDTRYQYESGTSMATPIASGMAGLLWQQNPTLTAAQIKALLVHTVQQNDGLMSTTSSGGWLQGHEAFQASSTNVSGLNHVQWSAQGLSVKGVNLQQLTGLSLNEVDISYERTDDQTLWIDASVSLSCGYLQGRRSDSTTNRLYLDWSPAPPMDITVSSDESTYVLSWLSPNGGDRIVIERLNAQGTFEVWQEVSNATQTVRLNGLNANDVVRLKTESHCVDRMGQPRLVASDDTPSITLGTSALPQWQTLGLASVVLDQTVDVTLQANGATAYELADLTAEECVPDGLTFDDGRLYGQPSRLQTCSFRVHASNVSGQITQGFQWSVVARQPLQTHMPLVLTIDSTVPTLGFTLILDAQRQTVLQWHQPLDVSHNQLRITLNEANKRFANVYFVNEQNQTISWTGNGDGKILDFVVSATQSYAESGAQRTYRLVLPTNMEQYAVMGKRSDSRCFIASQVYGHYQHPQVSQLRLIRDHGLHEYPWLSSWVDAYYQYSPQWVEWSKAHPRLSQPVLWLSRLFLDTVVQWYGRSKQASELS